MRKSCLLLALLSLAILPDLAEAGAWAQPQGERYLKLSFISYDADEHFNASGDREALGTLEDAFYSDQGFVYAEYGALQRLTVIAQTRWGKL